MSCRILLRRPRALAVVLLVLPILALPHSNAFAQPVPQVVVTATRSEQAITDTLASTTVLTREDIRDTQAIDLPTLLRSAAGIEVTQSGGPGTVLSCCLADAASNCSFSFKTTAL